jgi:MFS family permease
MTSRPDQITGAEPASASAAATGRTARARLAGPYPAGSQPALTSLGLMTLLIGVFLPMTDFFIVNVALPTIDRDLQAPAGMLQLVVAGYAIAYALLLVVGGRLGDAVGRKRLFLAGMAAFTVTSLACGVAPGIDALVAARALQGAASALMLPQVLSTIQATRSGPDRARALGAYGATGGIAVVAGQLLGGLLVSADIAGLGWRPIFLVNVPVGIAGIAMAARLVPDSRSDDPAPVDRRGTLLLGWATLALLIPLTEGRSLGWPVWTLVLLATAPLAAIAFVRAERSMEDRGGVPLVPFSLLRVDSMRRGLLLAVPFFTGFGGFMFVIALTLQDGSGISAIDAGLILVPMALGFLVASLSTARLLAVFGRRLLTAGALIQSAGLAAIIVELARSWPHPGALWMAPGMLVAGIGQGLIMSPLFGAVLSEVPPRQAGVGSGVLATTQQSSLALGVATLGSLYLTTSPAAVLGSVGPASVILGILVLTALAVAVLARRMPEAA